MKNTKDGFLSKLLVLVITAGLLTGLVTGCDDSDVRERLSSIKEYEADSSTVNGQPTVNPPVTDDRTSEISDEESTSGRQEHSGDDSTSKEQPGSDDETTSKEQTSDDETTSKEQNSDDENTSKEQPGSDNETTSKEQPSSEDETTSKEEESTEEPTTDNYQEDEIDINAVSAPGTKAESKNGFTLDYSNLESCGYIMVQNHGSPDTKGKVAITYPNGDYFNYNLNTDGEYEAYILSSGTGTYTVKLLLQAASGNWVTRMTCTFEVTEKLDAYTYPTSNVQYSQSSAAVALSYDLCKGKTSVSAKVKALYDYIIKNIPYDWDKYNSGETTQFPNADETLKKGKGVCSDLSCLFAVMCRAQRIPARMEWGYIYPGSNGGSAYHAWNRVYYSGVWNFYDLTKQTTSPGNITYTANKIF